MESGPVLVNVRRDGVVVSQSEEARRLLGDEEGRACWEHVGDVPGGEGLPCCADCVARLLARSRGRRPVASHHRVRIEGRPHLLTCSVVSEDSVACLLQRSGSETPEPHEVPTPRELEVLALIADGLGTGAIAEGLGMSVATVRTHVEHLRDKLGVASRAAIVARAFRLGLLD